MKINDRVLRFTNTWFRWCCFSSVHKGYHFVLLIWRCLGIKYGVDVISRTVTLEVLRLQSFYWAKFRIYLWNNLHKIFLVISFLEESWKNETYEIFCLKVFTLSLGSRFLLYILFCILGKWQHNLNYCFHS